MKSDSGSIWNYETFQIRNKQTKSTQTEAYFILFDNHNIGHWRWPKFPSLRKS